MIKRILVTFVPLVLLGILSIVSGCAGRDMPGDAWKDDKLSRVWPSPPAEPRIELLRVVSGGGALESGKKGHALLEWLIGKSDEQLPLVSPYGIAADGEGTVWVADPGNSNVHVFDLIDKSVDYLNQAVDIPFVSPVDVEYDPRSARLFVSDSGLAKVFVFSATGKFQFEISPASGFGRPAGLAIDSNGLLYVVDVVKGLVEVFSPQGAHLKSIGSAAAPNGLFRNPSNVAIDKDDNIYVVDSLRFRIEVQSADGGLLAVIGQVGDRPGSFARPRGISVDSFGHIYVVDAAFDNIQVFDLTGKLLLYFGGPGRSAGDFCLPAGLHIDHEDRIYVAESCNYRFQIFQFLGAETE